MTDLHWIHGTLQREAARYPVTIHARFQDTYYSWLDVWKGSPAMTMTRGPKLALAWMDRPALALLGQTARTGAPSVDVALRLGRTAHRRAATVPRVRAGARTRTGRLAARNNHPPLPAHQGKQ